jgi:hypothetical protein
MNGKNTLSLQQTLTQTKIALLSISTAHSQMQADILLGKFFIICL